MLDQLFPVYFIEPRYPDKLALGIYQAMAQVFIFATHGLEHILGARCERVRQTEKGRGLRAVAIHASAADGRGSSVLLAGELLGESQR
jgi:hypothetical protein